ncbi:hypothetical protein D3C76_163600 [compost metagenome]
MAETLFLVPLENIPQDFNMVVAGNQVRIVCKWNEFSGWLIDLYDSVTQEPLIMAIPLVTGCDLLEQFRYVGVTSNAIVYTDGDQYAVPTLDNLGNESNLYLLVDV